MTTSLDKQIDEMVEYARQLGAEHGKNAAGWWEQDAIGGRASGDTKETARRIIAMCEDGDPEFYDSIPQPDLSGQWADDVNSESLVQAAADAVGVEGGALGDRFHVWGDVADAYEEAFSMAVEDEVLRVCHLALADDED